MSGAKLVSAKTRRPRKLLTQILVWGWVFGVLFGWPVSVLLADQTASAAGAPALSLPESQTLVQASTFADIVPGGNGDVLTGFSSNVRALLSVDEGELRIGGGSTYDGVNFTLTVNSVTVDIPFGYRSAQIASGGTGESELAIEGTSDDVNAALAELEFSRAAGTSILTVSAVKSGNNISFSQETGHYYEFVNSSITWQNARCAAKFVSGAFDTNSLRFDKCNESNLAAMSFNGLTGYLATVTSEDENTFITSKAGSSAAWIGGSDLATTRTVAAPSIDITATEATWRWVDGPEAGLIFWKTGCGTGLVNSCSGADTNTQFSYWNGGEPNNSGGEEAIQLLSGGTGKWNDLPEDSRTLPYIIEYGGLSGESATEEVTDTVSLTVAQDGPPTGVTGSSRDSSVAVSWTSPIIVTGTTVSSYTVTSTPGGFTCTTTSTSCTVTGLTNGTSYTFVVDATFADSNTRTSIASTGITPAAPAPARTSTPTPIPAPVVIPPAPTPPRIPPSEPEPVVTPEPAPEPVVVPEPEPDPVVVPEPEPEPPVAPEPTDLGTLLSDPGQVVQLFTQVGQPTPNSSIGASGDDSVIVAFDPMGSPEAVQATTNLVGATAAVAGVAAAAAGAASAAAASGAAAAAGAASGAAGSAAGASGGAAGGGTGAGGGGQAAPSADMNEDVLDAMAGADFEYDLFHGRPKRWGDRLSIWNWALATLLDKPSAAITRWFGPISPMVSKLANDATYLRAMFGPLALALPLAGIWLALESLRVNDGVLLHPPVMLFMGLVGLGIIDAFAGSLAMVVFVVGSLPLVDVTSITDWRLLAGIIVAGFGPIFIARSIRDFRRPINIEKGELTKRLGDIAFASLMGGWVAGLIVRSLPALTGLTLPAANYVFTFQIVATGVIALRILLEDTAARLYPWRMDQLTPDNIKEPPVAQKTVATLFRFWFYIFIASAFMGFGPIVLLAALLFMTPNIVGLFADKLPNSRLLWRALPTGIAGLAMMLALEIILENSLGAALGDHPQFSIIFIFCLLALILVVSTLGMMAREGKPGESHWLESSRLGWLRRIGAVGLFFALIQLTSML